jgi:3-oxoacyl-[acyl-carrier protein] reductase
MLTERYGRILFVTSPAGRFGFEGQGNYGASKAGQIGLARSLCKEVAKRGITVNCVSPGFVATELLDDLPEKTVAAHKASVPMRRFGKPEEVASAVMYLASREAAYITGAVLEVTGGL